jgi:hypothetical protein
MAKTHWFWNPCQDTGHEAQCQKYVDDRDNCEWLGAWTDIQSGDDLCIAGHGDGTDPSVIAGVDAGGTLNAYDYAALATSIMGGVASTLKFQIKLYMCFAADRKVRPGDAPSGIEVLGHRFFEKKYCFAGQLLSEFKANGYQKIKIAAYHGSLYWGQHGSHKVVCTKKNAPGTLAFHPIMDKAHGLGILVVPRLGYSAARHHREWFTDNFLGTRWL